VPTRINIEHWRGDTFNRTLTIKDSDGVVVDITGWTFLAQVREAPGESVVATITVSITDAPNGEVNLLISAANTAAVAVGTYRYDVQATKADAGSTVETVLRGAFVIVDDTSRS